MNGQQTDARAQTSAGCQYGSSCHAVRTGYQQTMSEIAFVGKASARLDHLAYVAGFGNGIRRSSLFDEVLADTDVEQFPFAYDVFIFGEKERQFRQLDAQGEIGTDDILTDIVGIVFSHQARRQIDGNDGRL